MMTCCPHDHPAQRWIPIVDCLSLAARRCELSSIRQRKGRRDIQLATRLGVTACRIKEDHKQVHDGVGGSFADSTETQRNASHTPAPPGTLRLQ